MHKKIFLRIVGVENTKKINERIDELEKEIKLLRSEIRYLKYVWDFKEFTTGEKDPQPSVYVDTRKENK